MRWTIRKKFFLILAATLLPLLLLAVYRTYARVQNERSAIHSEAFRLAQTLAVNVDEFIVSRKQILASIAEILEQKRWAPAELPPLLVRLKNQYPHLENLVILDREGHVEALAVPPRDPSSTVFIRDTPWFKRLIATAEPQIGEPRIGPATGMPVVGLLHPIKDRKGRVEGAVVMGIGLTRLQERWVGIRLPEGSVVTLLTNRGVIVARSHRSEEFVLRDVSSRPGFQRTLQKREGVEESIWMDDVRRLFAYTQTRDAPWILTVGIPTAVAYREVWAALMWDVVGIVAALLMAGTVGLLTTHPLTRAIRNLNKEAQAVKTGDLSVRVQPSGRDEIGELTEQFNEMVAATRDHLERIEASTLEATRAQETLREISELNKRIIESLLEGVIVFDHKLRYRAWNPFMEKLSGLPAEQVLGKHPLEIFPFLKEQGVVALLERALAGETVSTPSNTPYVLPDTGKTMWTMAKHSPLRDSEGRVTGVVVAISDITDRKLAEDALRRSEERFRLFVEHSPAAIAMFDREMGYLAVSRRWMTDYGLGDKTIIGLSHYEVFPEIPQRWKEIHQRSLAGAVEKCEEDPFPRADGHTDWVRWEIHPWGDDRGEIGGIVMFTEIITERKRAEEEIRALNTELEQRIALRTRELEQSLEELAEAKDKAEAANRLKSAFLATMSHELRTPLNSIIGFTGVISQGLAGPVNTEQGRQLALVQQASQHLLALINDILDLSRIEVGELRVVREPFLLAELINEVVVDNAPQVKARDQELAVMLDPSVGSVESDRRRVYQILTNLVSNAIKFTREGGRITVRMSRVAGTDAITITVEDTGIGIPPEELPRIFDRFYQVDHQLTRKHQGTGLGLAISKRLVEMLDGAITVQSEVGKGSQFTLRLPVKPPRDAPGNGA